MYMLMLGLSLILLLILNLLFYMISYKKIKDMESSSSYECGFDIMSLTRVPFSYRFFLISILFLVFDVEIVLMLVLPYFNYNIFNVWVFFIFLMVLIVGLLYEYWYGSLCWL